MIRDNTSPRPARLDVVRVSKRTGESGHGGGTGSGAARARTDMLVTWVRDSLRDISDEQPDDPSPLRALAFVTTREVIYIYIVGCHVLHDSHAT